VGKDSETLLHLRRSEKYDVLSVRSISVRKNYTYDSSFRNSSTISMDISKHQRVLFATRICNSFKLISGDSLKNAELQKKIQRTPHETLHVLLDIWDTFWKVAIENEIYFKTTFL
jgi:hypothetical protein